MWFSIEYSAFLLGVCPFLLGSNLGVISCFFFFSSIAYSLCSCLLRCDQTKTKQLGFMFNMDKIILLWRQIGGGSLVMILVCTCVACSSHAYILKTIFYTLNFVRTLGYLQVILVLFHPFMYLFIFTQALIGDPRRRIQVDLLEFQKIIKCTCCSENMNSLLPCAHDSTIM